MTIKLYSYQERVIEAIITDPSNSQLISMPTGTGKTITFLATIKHFGKPTLILVHRQELLDQTVEKAKKIGFSEDEIAIISSKKKECLKKINIAMVPTLSRNLARYNPDDISMIVVDEAHHVLAKSYMDILDHFDVFDKNKILLGFTATPLRGDGKALSDVFSSHSFKMTLSEATKDGFICPVHGLRIFIEKSLAEIKQMNGDYDISQLDNIMNCDSINRLIAEKCENLSKSRSPGIVFCTSVDHAKNIAKELRRVKKKAISISYKTKPSTLKNIMRWFKEGRIDFITNAIKLSEGFDHPAIQTVILARPTRSPVLYKQMIGRGLRKYEGKFDCLVMEFSGNDEKMICWDDIDENCSFQSISQEEKRTRKDALRSYRSKFGSKVDVLDVRISPFNFYECKVRRCVVYKKDWFFCINSLGFTLGHCRKGNPRNGITPWNLYGWDIFWKDIYKSCYVFCHSALWNKPGGWGKKTLWDQFKYCTERNGMDGIWYPSEEEPMNGWQKSILGNNINYSARKAQFLIENKIVSSFIWNYFMNEKWKTERIMTWNMKRNDNV